MGNCLSTSNSKNERNKNQNNTENFILSRQGIPEEFHDGLSYPDGFAFPVHNRGLATVVTRQPTATTMSPGFGFPITLPSTVIHPANYVIPNKVFAKSISTQTTLNFPYPVLAGGGRHCLSVAYQEEAEEENVCSKSHRTFDTTPLEQEENGGVHSHQNELHLSDVKKSLTNEQGDSLKPSEDETQSRLGDEKVATVVTTNGKSHSFQAKHSEPVSPTSQIVETETEPEDSGHVFTIKADIELLKIEPQLRETQLDQTSSCDTNLNGKIPDDISNDKFVATFHRNDSFTKAVRGDEEEEESEPKNSISSEEEDCLSLEGDQNSAKYGWFESSRLETSLDLEDFRASRRLSVLKEESEESESVKSCSDRHSATPPPVTQPNSHQDLPMSTSTFESSKFSACSRSLDLITAKETNLGKKCRPEFSRHLSDDPFLPPDFGLGGSGRSNVCVESPSRLPRSTSRPLVMANSSANSLCSSSTLLPNSPSDSEITDLEPDEAEEEVFGSVSCLNDPDNNSDPDPFDPPQVSISSCESTDPSCSASIYESPVSSFNESPTSSPSYATPMERSPWASPQSSIKGFSPTGSIRSPPPLISPPGRLLRVRSPASNGSSETLFRSQSVKHQSFSPRDDFDQLTDFHPPDRGDTFKTVGLNYFLPNHSIETSFLHRKINCDESSKPKETTSNPRRNNYRRTYSEPYSAVHQKQNFELPTGVVISSEGLQIVPEHKSNGKIHNHILNTNRIEQPQSPIQIRQSDSHQVVMSVMQSESGDGMTEEALEGLEDESLKFADDSDVETESESSSGSSSKRKENEDGPRCQLQREKGRSFRRSVAFDLSLTQELQRQEKSDCIPIIKTESSNKSQIQEKEIAKENCDQELLETKIDVIKSGPIIEVATKSPEPDSNPAPKLVGILKPPNPSSKLRSFPSLPETFLDQLGIGPKIEQLRAENLSDQEIESKFTSLSLAFKTDKLTLTNRLDLQQRQRDIAEKNIEEEIKQLKSALESLNHLCVDVETRGILQRIQQQVDVLRHASDRVSSSAEVYGAVQQEARISRAIDIVLLHVDNLKKIHDREHSELEECKRILAEHNLSIDDGGGSLSLGLGDLRSNPNRIRSVSVINHSNGSPHGVGSSSLSAGSLDSPKMRRASASVATLTQSKVQQNPDSQRSTLSNQVTLATPVNKLTRRVGIVTSSFRKTSSPSGSHLSATPVNVNLTGQELKLAGSSKEMKEDLVTRFKEDLMSNQMTDEANNNHTQLKSDQVKTNNNHAKNNSEAAHSKPKFRSRSLIEPVKEEDESLLMDEIDELAKKRDSSPAPPAFRNTVQNVRKNSLYMQLVQWYKELYWPWDWEETILGLRYSLTGLLLFAAFVSFIYTIFSAQRPSKPEL